MRRLTSALAALLFLYATATGRNLVNSSITADGAIGDSNRTPGYTIITTSAIRSASSKLDDFIAHKQSLGFEVQVATEEDFGGGIGDTAAENIRTWLQGNYMKDNIEYVLLIGDPRPEVSEVPMKTLLPEAGESVLSDLYYADLTGNWDLDGDGRYGEWGEDFGSGGVDRHWEVMVGRIPCYKTEGAQFPYAESLEYLDWILEKTMRYERQTSDEAEWRKNALLAMCFGAHSCYRAEAIKKQILEPAGWDCHRIYEPNYAEYCPNADPEKVLNLFERACHEEVCEIWNPGKFGLVIGFSHSGGSINPACMLDPEDPNDGYPSFTFHASCSQADPGNRDNNAYQLLRMRNGGAICTLAATAVSGTYPPSWDDPAGTPGIMGMAYEYTSRLVAGLTSGQAVYGLREKVSLMGWSSGWRNFVIYNLYGDPALQLAGFTRRIVFVDADAPGPHDGSSWATAYNYLQDAITAGSPGDEVWVAHGIYKPDANSLNPNGSGDPNATFQLKNGLVIKGGYAGFGEPDPNARDIGLYETILSGEIGVPDTNGDNSYHIVTAGKGTCEASVLHGFTITEGNANGDEPDNCGGGVYIHTGSPTITNCTIRENCASNEGGGMFNYNSSTTVTNCRFIHNSAPSHRGGGMSNIGASPVLKNCRFTWNSAPWGGGIYNDHESSLLLTRCTFSGNKAGCGGAMRCFYGSAWLANCTLTGNQAGIEGGAMCNRGSGPILANCILWANRPEQISGDASVTFSDVEGGWEGCGNIDADPCFAMPGYWDLSDTPDNADDDFWVDGDYHLNSKVGRWDPNRQGWVPDDVTSPCIDAGNPGCALGDEPNEPGNVRINMGAYGDTAEASKSPAGWRSIADLTNDFKVDFSDLDIFARYWLDRGQCIPSDFNRDYSADFEDFAVLAEDWLQ